MSCLLVSHHTLHSLTRTRSASSARRRITLGRPAARVGVVAEGGERAAAVADERRVGRDEPLLHALLLLHPPVLEPDLDLRLVELQRRGDLYPPRPRQVLVEVELLLQLRQLLRREVGPPRVVEALLVLTAVDVPLGFRNCKGEREKRGRGSVQAFKVKFIR